MSLEDNAERGFKPRQEQPTLHEVCRMLTRLNYGDFTTLTDALEVYPSDAFPRLCDLEKKSAPQNLGAEPAFRALRNDQFDG